VAVGTLLARENLLRIRSKTGILVLMIEAGDKEYNLTKELRPNVR